VALTVVIGAVDFARFHGASGVGVANFVIVWITASTLGIVVRDWPDARRGQLWWLAVGAVAANTVAVRFGPYPVSMVGMPGEPVSNMSPPTLALTLHSYALVAIVGACWPALEAWCARPRVWRATQLLGAVAMSLYLWHLTALILLIVVEHQLGIARPDVHAPWFWPATLLHLAVFALLVIPLVVLVARLEVRPIPWLEHERPPAPASAGRMAAALAGVVVIGIALLVLAATGMDGFPFERVAVYAGIPLAPGYGFLALAAGLFLARYGGRTTPVVARSAIADRHTVQGS
jgi:hypothetical protein